jgi:hypothetical protein
MCDIDMPGLQEIKSEKSFPAAHQAERSVSRESADSIMQDVRNEVRALQRNNAAGLIPLPQHQCTSNQVEEKSSNGLWDRIMTGLGHKAMSHSSQRVTRTPTTCQSSVQSHSLSPMSHKCRMDGARTPKTPATHRSSDLVSSDEDRKCSDYSIKSTRTWEPRQTTYWSIPFRLAVICPTFAMIFVSSVAFVALAILSHQAQHET